MHFNDEIQRLEFYLKDCEEENKKLHEKLKQIENILSCGEYDEQTKLDNINDLFYIK